MNLTMILVRVVDIASVVFLGAFCLWRVLVTYLRLCWDTVPALPLRGSGELRFQYSTYIARRYAIDAKGAAWKGVRDLPLELTSTEELLRVCFDEEERAKITALIGATP